ncbi:MAG: glycosyltransferase family 2 protein [Candidatus Omnitrophica bacterium]|nr:glycosyltransferase family 2 protein [Candidatus Omnitrophota bacterium]
MKCDIIIPVWNQLASTRECVEAIVRATDYPYRLIIIDNGSDLETKRYLESLKKTGPSGTVIICNEKNLGYVKAVNQGLRVSDAPYVCLMNNDTVPGAGWLGKLVSFAERHEDAGLMNPLCNGHSGKTVDAYALEVAANGDEYMEMNQCFGFCTLIKREVIDKIGFLDEAFGIGGYDDTDYSMRAGNAGYRCVSVHSAYVYHKEHVSFKAAGVRDSFTVKGQQEYLKKWQRHLRIGVGFSMGERAGDAEAGNVLKTILYLARRWCWINFWVFGGRPDARGRIKSAGKKINMPLHQNIKSNFMPGAFPALQLLLRLLERSFGTKKRKKYDAVFVDTRGAEAVLRFFYPIHRTDVFLVGAGDDMLSKAARVVDDILEIKK